MIDTEGLIERLAEIREPARPLAPPWRRTANWLAFAVPSIVLVVAVMSPRPDLIAKVGDARFLIEQTGALLTALTAAVAAFAITVPGFERRVLLLPVIPAVAWLGTLTQGCLRDWIEFGADGLSLQPDWSCFPSIVLVGSVPAVAIAIMLRRGAPLRPHATTALGGLAAAGLGDFGLRFFHTQDASLMVVVWQVGTVVILSALAAMAGRYLLSWQSLIGRVRRRIAAE
jgi:hypothetical protein